MGHSIATHMIVSTSHLCWTMEKRRGTNSQDIPKKLPNIGSIPSLLGDSNKSMVNTFVGDIWEI